MDINSRINHLIELVEIELEKYVKLDQNKNYRVYDPIENKTINEHYADTHYATAKLIRSLQSSDPIQIDLSKKMIYDILDTIDDYSKLPGYHNDFNLFALCVAFDNLEDDIELSSRLKAKILIVPDSNHLTTNWLPMRIFVNKHRYEWTNKTIYLDKCDELVMSIKKVTFNDGFIDDRYPKGVSYNLQYNVATVSSLLFTKLRYDIDIDLETSLSSLISAIFPDGDINYFGRGTNQIFAWGLWIYLLSTVKQDKILDLSLTYLENKIPEMLLNNNIFLNHRKGKEKYMWWDYHYSIVYTSHLYLWLVLSLQDTNKFLYVPQNTEISDSGIKIFKNNDSQVILFAGRKEYLSERGPSIAGIWTKKYGTIKKGYFGPWGGPFGNKYLEKDITFRNFIGLLQMKINSETCANKILRKLGVFMTKKNYQIISPEFDNIGVFISKEYIKLRYNSKSSKSKFMNFPIMYDSSLTDNDFEIRANEIKIETKLVGKIEDQYGLCNLYQSNTSPAKNWEILIKL
ncbi:MAG: hypothetical protein ABII85_05460 [Bacillota bacterium]